MKTTTALLLLLTCAVALAAPDVKKGTRAALDEDFGYVDVRPGAHMFWVTYHVDAPDEWTNYPLIMWLQGGPGSSGVGYGNFEELGPYYVDGTLREYAWTKRANVMFVDNPVGTGYSYVDDLSLLTTTNQQIADDLVALLTSVFTDYPEMSGMPFFVYAESYGGKMTADFALALDAAIKRGDIVCNFQGVGLGDSWISPMDSVNTWGPFLYQMGLVNAQGQANIDASAANTQAAVDAGDWVEATNRWSNTEAVVEIATNGVNFYNVLATENIYYTRSNKSKHDIDLSTMSPAVRNLYRRHVQPSYTTRDALGDLMNGPQADRWGIPDGVVWGGQSNAVFNTLSEDFMKPVVNSVVRLLEETDIFVAVYTGDLDLICDTPGTYRWMENMDYTIKPDFESTRRTNIYVPQYSNQAGYVQQFGRLALFTILRSGHMVPTDAPVASLEMVDMITAYAASNKKQAVKQPEEVHAAENKKKEPTKVESTKTVKSKSVKKSDDKPAAKKLVEKKAADSKKVLASDAARASTLGRNRLRSEVPTAGQVPRRKVDAISRKLDLHKRTDTFGI